jgi:hypothetical protein
MAFLQGVLQKRGYICVVFGWSNVVISMAESAFSRTVFRL